MPLEPIVIVNGVFSIIIVFISFLISFTLLIRYKQYKQKTFLYVAFTSIGIFSFWWSSSISFLIALFNDVGLEPLPNVYLIIMGLLTAPTILTWMLAVDSLMQKKSKLRQYLIIIILIESIILEVIYLTTAVMNPLLLGDLQNPVDVHFSIVGIIIYVNVVIIITTISLIFSLNSMKSHVIEVRIKGIFLLIGTILLLISSFADAIIPLEIFGVTIIRILLIVSIFMFYCGFHLPSFLKNILIKE